MTPATLLRALRITLNLLAWASLPMLGPDHRVRVHVPRAGDITIDTGMLLCGMCALSRVVQLHQDARIAHMTEADDAQKRALIRAINDAAGPSTGPIRLLRDAS